MCLYPQLIKNKKYTANKKNRGVIPPILDERVKYVAVGCGNCIECRKQKARAWQLRLLEEIKNGKKGVFVTLTFSNEAIAKLLEDQKEEFKEAYGYQMDNKIATVAVRLWLERWRKKYKKSLRHWLVTELGHEGTENVHMHGLVWLDTIGQWEDISKTWQYGHIWPREKKDIEKNYVSSRTVNYIIKYVTKIDVKHKYYRAKILTSPGIGGNYIGTQNSKLNKYNGEKTIQTYRTETGHKIAMPTYWRNKTYSEEEREKLWLQLMDKNERWVCGEKVKADDIEEYEKLREYHRKQSKKMGYGDGEKDWDQEQYENRQREILRNKRIAKAKAREGPAAGTAPAEGG